MNIQEINKFLKEIDADFIRLTTYNRPCLTNRCPNCNTIHETKMEAEACCFGWDLDNDEVIEQKGES